MALVYLLAIYEPFLQMFRKLWSRKILIWKLYRYQEGIKWNSLMKYWKNFTILNFLDLKLISTVYCKIGWIKCDKIFLICYGQNLLMSLLSLIFKAPFSHLWKELTNFGGNTKNDPYQFKIRHFPKLLTVHVKAMSN